jgi:selenium metabolism protein YedF
LEEKMSEIINAKGLGCPQPVILAKNALKEYNKIQIFVDNEIAAKNIEKFAKSNNADYECKKNSNTEYEIKLSNRNELLEQKCECEYIKSDIIIVFKSEFMGTGDDELGRLLMNAYIHTIEEMDCRPDTLIFYNSGIKLAAEESDTVDDLRKLEKKGIKIIICGTCANFFNLTENIKIGTISNMYDISEILITSSKVIYP